MVLFITGAYSHLHYPQLHHAVVLVLFPMFFRDVADIPTQPREIKLRSEVVKGVKELFYIFTMITFMGGTC